MQSRFTLSIDICLFFWNRKNHPHPLITYRVEMLLRYMTNMAFPAFAACKNRDKNKELLSLEQLVIVWAILEMPQSSKWQQQCKGELESKLLIKWSIQNTYQMELCVRLYNYILLLFSFLLNIIYLHYSFFLFFGNLFSFLYIFFNYLFVLNIKCLFNLLSLKNKIQYFYFFFNKKNHWSYPIFNL